MGGIWKASKQAKIGQSSIVNEEWVTWRVVLACKRWHQHVRTLDIIWYIFRWNICLCLCMLLHTFMSYSWRLWAREQAIQCSPCFFLCSTVTKISTYDSQHSCVVSLNRFLTRPLTGNQTYRQCVAISPRYGAYSLLCHQLRLGPHLICLVFCILLQTVVCEYV